MFEISVIFKNIVTNLLCHIKIDKIGRALSNLAKRNQLKRLSTNIPKYKLQISMLPSLKFN